MKSITRMIGAVAISAATLMMTGCGTTSGAVVGGVAGAAVGGSAASTVGGAVVGGVVGHELNKNK